MNIAVKEIVAETDEWARWHAALAGHHLDLGERGNPPSGYFRFPASKTAKDKPQEAVAVWRGDDGEIQCARNVYGDGSNMSAMQIDEMFASEHYAIPYDLYVAVTERGEAWPEIYTTRLRTKDITSGVVWTEEWARAHLAANVETHDEAGNPRAVIGNNEPPADLTPDQALALRIKTIGEQLAALLKKFGGAPTTQAEADLVGAYATRFKDCENEADAAHSAEKAPHWQKCKDVDSKWFGPVRDKAIECRSRTLKIVKAYTDAETAKRAEAARAANEVARASAEAYAKATDTAPEPVAEVVAEPVKVATVRGGYRAPAKVWTVTDLSVFLIYCAALTPPPPDLVEACSKIARKFGAASVNAPGMELRDPS